MKSAALAAVPVDFVDKVEELFGSFSSA